MPTEQEQERYWELSYGAARAREELRQAEIVRECLELRIRHLGQAYGQAYAAYQAFLQEHKGKSFKVFRPEHIMAMEETVHAEPMDL